MISSANAPTEDIKDMLEESTSGLGLIYGTDLFLNILPNSPHNCVALMDYEGMPQLKYGFERPNVQILIRNSNSLTGYALCRDIKYYLHDKNNEVWNGTRYIRIFLKSDIMYLGIDDKNRHLWSINFQVYRSGI